jgi:hypothetical protein
MSAFVPPGFEVPRHLRTRACRLEPLGPEHNERDFAAWTSSMDHIRATPGFAGRAWPHAMSLEDNLGDLERHAADFEARTGFTYTVLEPEGDDVIGCVYIYPDAERPDVASVRSWVRASHARLDRPVHDAVADWLARDWPFAHVEYAERR